MKNKIIIKEGELRTIIRENIRGETEIICKKNSSLKYYVINTNAQEDVSSDTTIILEKESSVVMKNIMISNKQKQKDNIKIIHKGEKTRSWLENKAVLSNSNVEIKGLINIEEQAADSEGYQSSDFLILKDSRVISVPDLEIKNNKVKCTHSSTITRLDEEKIFYLQTRGISEADSKKLMLSAFLEDAIKNIEDKERERLSKILGEKISEMERAE
ncbi:MAG: SufD family Fe-S cluster assembly protein [Candidatus Nanoarchaeia archaeon]